jgi:carboxymethylenebutenolidase
MKVHIALVILVLVVFAGCLSDLETSTNTTLPSENSSIHGETISLEAQLPVEDGQYQSFGQEVDYGPATGYLATARGVDNAPGVVLIHEWWGLNQNIKDTADKLATHGYNVLAVDLYNGQVAQDSSQARELVGSVNQQEALTNLDSAQEYLRSTGSSRIGSWGFCFGGAQSMNLAVSEFAPDASVIYYGTPITAEQELASIRQPLLGIFGSQDSSISVESVQEMDEKLDGITNHSVIIYEGANHAFANPSGDRFDEDAASQAWQETLSFLSENLQ